MSKIFNDKNVIELLNKYGCDLDLTDPKAKDFISNTAGAILMLVPDITIYAAKGNFDSDDPAVPYKAMAALGELLMTVGKVNLEKVEYLKGDSNEDNTDINASSNVYKLCN